MTTGEILPLPESTYRLLLEAAGAWPDAVATQWIPDPADHTRCLAWTYAELAGTVTRIANALTTLGVRRADAVTLSQRQHLDAVRGHAGRGGRRDRRPGQPRPVRRSGSPS